MDENDNKMPFGAGDMIFVDKDNNGDPSNQEIKEAKGVIKFNKVFFSYPREKNTLVDFNLVLEPNKKIAIVGRSGQGKTTLFNLITRIFDTSKGKILINGINNRNQPKVFAFG